MTLIQQLHDALTLGLPGEDAHAKLAPLRRGKSSEALKKAKNVRQSAVAVFVQPEGNQLNCILTKRRSYRGVHSGQISFPGGKEEPEDINPEMTARREAMEEVGIPTEVPELIAQLTEVYVPPSNFLVRPFLFALHEQPTLIADSREVEEIIVFDALQLLEESIVKQTDIRVADGMVLRNIPYFDLNGHVVWGATAIMLSELREILRRM